MAQNLVSASAHNCWVLPSVIMFILRSQAPEYRRAATSRIGEDAQNDAFSSRAGFGSLTDDIVQLHVR